MGQWATCSMTALILIQIRADLIHFLAKAFLIIKKRSVHRNFHRNLQNHTFLNKYEYWVSSCFCYLKNNHLPFIWFQVSSYLLTQIFLKKTHGSASTYVLNASIHSFLIYEFEILKKEKNTVFNLYNQIYYIRISDRCIKSQNFCKIQQIFDLLVFGNCLLSYKSKDKQ